MNVRSVASVIALGSLLAVPLPASLAVDRGRVEAAVARCVTYIRSEQRPDGTFVHSSSVTGPTALAGLTLLECGASADDLAVRRAAAAVRRDCPSLDHTYSLALAILFLDRLGDADDEALIQSLALRLLAGQSGHGGWTYQCPTEASEPEQRRLRAAAERPAQARRSGAPWARQLPPDLGQRIEVLKQRRPADGQGPVGDNSNTQFALVGLWAAARHGVPMGDALKRAEVRFRTSQNPDGSWSYVPGQGGGSVAMTCAGLLALALAEGKNRLVQLRTRPLPRVGERALAPFAANQDEDVCKALAFVEANMDRPPVVPVGYARGDVPVDYYSFWSILRVGGALGRDKLVKRDWYDCGARVCLAAQLKHGKTRGAFFGTGRDEFANNCFAALFLMRRNLVEDLTVMLDGRVPELATVGLRAGGVGADLVSGAKPSPAGPDEERAAERLCKALLQTQAESWTQELDRLAAAKGSANTSALVKAIARCQDKSRTWEVRNALARRLSAFTAATLREYLHDDSPELRRAAAIACAMKEGRDLVPEIRKLLKDPDPFVVRGARAALKELGSPPPASSPPAEGPSKPSAPASPPSSGALESGLAAGELNDTLEPIRRRYDLPALAAAVIRDGRLDRVSAVGVRRYGTREAVTPKDCFHLGSCTKALTATLLAVLVEKGKLRWDQTLAESLPQLRTVLQPAYRSVTLEQLLTHRGGLPALLKPGEPIDLNAYRRPGDPREQRLAFARQVLSLPPEVEPGTRFLYSNAGYVVAAVIAEQATRTSWEKLMQDLLFRPLHMTTAGFGPMREAGRLNQPAAHKLANGAHVVVELAAADNPPVLGPAGRVHCSLDDWARFAAEHLHGARGERGLLRRETFQKLQTPLAGQDYAMGWSVITPSWGEGPVLTHAGSNGLNYCILWVAPARNFAVLVATNQGGDEARKACEEAGNGLIHQFLGSAP